MNEIFVKVNLPGYYIINNGNVTEITKEEYDEYLRTHSVCDLALGDELDNGTAQWIRTDGNKEAVCSKCGAEVVYQIIDNKWQFENYCPHCGRKMLVSCDSCKYLKLLNQKDVYALCEKQYLKFKPFGLDTRTHTCKYAEREDYNGEETI